jgi:hypothetical protein
MDVQGRAWQEKRIGDYGAQRSQPGVGILCLKIILILTCKGIFVKVP